MSNFHFPIITENFTRSDEKIQTLAGLILYEDIDFQCGFALKTSPIVSRNIVFGENIDSEPYNSNVFGIQYKDFYYLQEDYDDDDDDG